MTDSSRVLFYLPTISHYRDRIHLLYEVSRRIDRLVLLVGKVDETLDVGPHPGFEVVSAGYKDKQRVRNLFRAGRIARRLVDEQRLNIVHDTFGDLVLLLRDLRNRSGVVTCSSIYSHGQWRLSEVWGEHSHLRLLARRQTARLYYVMLMQKLLARYCDYLVVQAPALIDRTRYGVDLEPSRFGVLMNSVDIDFWKPHAAPRVDDGTVRLIFVGNIGWSKGSQVLMDTMRELDRRGLDAELTMVGLGAEKILSLRSRYGLEGRIHFPGWLSRESIREAFRSHDLFVYQTVDDSSPRVVLEAMSTGLPVVASRHPGIEVLDPDEEAIKFTAYGEWESIADAVERFGRERDVWARRACRARQIAVDRFSTGVIADEYVKWYHRIRMNDPPA